MKIVSLTIDGFHNVSHKTYTFEQINYLIGRNGVGKSTVLQAIQLALLGYIPGTSKNSKEALFRHSNSHTMSVALELEGVTISRTWAKSSSSINSTVRVDPVSYDIKDLIGEIELPVFNFNEFIGMTANKLKDWFVDFLPSATNEIDWKQELSDALESAHISDDLKARKIESMLEEIGEMQKQGLVGVDLIRAVNDRVKACTSFFKSEVSRIESVIQTIVFHDEIDPNLTEDMVQARISVLESQKAMLLDWQHRKQLYEQSIKMLEQYADCAEGKWEDSEEDQNLNLELCQVIDKLNDTKDKIEKLQTELRSMDGIEGELEQKLEEANAAKRNQELILNAGDACPITHTTCHHLGEAKAEAKVEYDKIQEVLEKLSAERIQQRDARRKLADEIAELSNQAYGYASARDAMSRNMETRARRYAERDKMKASLAADPGECPVPENVRDVNEINTEIQKLRETWANIKGNAQYEAGMKEFTRYKFEAQEALECFKIWDKLTGVNGLQTTQSSSVFIDFEGKMNKYISALFDGKEAMFNIAATANSFNFGICEKDNRSKYIPFDLLSSGEKCLFTLVLLICIIESSGSQVPLLLVDDIFDHLDDENVTKLFTLLPSITDIQMIFAGVKIVNDVDINIVSIGE